MDNKSVKTYTDKESFERIFNNIYAKFQSFLKLKESAILVKFISYSNNKAYFEIKDCDESLENCIIISRDDTKNTIYTYLDLLEKKDSVTYIFTPVKIQIVFIPREEERKILNFNEDINSGLYIINMISEFIIRKSLELNNIKKTQIENTIKVKLNETFQYVRICFNRNNADDRMDYFRSSIKPIFIPNINSEPDDNNKEPFNFYKNTIYPNDILLQNKNLLVSEISVPITYGMKIPYGYIQVNNNSPFTESSVQAVKKMALIINELLIKQGVFPEAEEKLTVGDISKNGIGIIFKNKQCIKYFINDQLVYFDLMLPAERKVNILALVKHITIYGTMYKAGCKIVNIDALNEIDYNEYLVSIGLKI
jgi:hypothetical protein